VSRIIDCVKLKKPSEGLATPPYPGELGKKIYESVSREAWQLWIAHQTMLINEYRLSMVDAKARDFLKVEMEKFLFGEGSDNPAGFVPPVKN
jgi:Fe-S cluster biosynthesis and repair protein YggX